jgi:hydrophobic/amphiphilic exporter-1 (mainly G- bacteria), HAE1 family
VRLPEHAVRRPVTVLMAALAVAVFGLLAAQRLPVELLPDLSYPTLTIQTTYPDAAPASVEQLVTRPIEEAVGVIPGVRSMRSTSRAGISEVVLEFDWDEQMDFAALDVREKLGLVELPLDAPRPRVLRYDPSLEPVMRVSFQGRRELTELRGLADDWLEPRLEATPGVAAAKVRGGLEPEVVVEVDVDRLGALGLTLDDVGRALRAENVDRPGGTLRDAGAVFLVRTLHEFEDTARIGRTVIREGLRPRAVDEDVQARAATSGAAGLAGALGRGLEVPAPAGRVRVEDVAQVTRGHRDRQDVTRSQGQEGVELALHREGSTNTLVVAAAARAELERLRAELPPDLRLEIVGDQSGYVGDAIRQVWSAALLGGLLAIAVLYFFLRDPLSTAIVGLTIPLSIVATFLPMLRAGVSLNIMSLGGLALGVGMLVDNSIVVLEAIDRHRRRGLDRRQAAIRGATEVAGAVTAATLTTVSVFVPIVFVDGVAGQLFYDLAVTVCMSLLASLAVSLTVIPSLAAIEPSGWQARAGRTLFAWDSPLVPGAAPTPGAWGAFRLGGLVLLPVGDGRHWISRALTALLFPPRLLLLLAALALGGAGRLTATAFDLLARPAQRLLDALTRAYPGALRAALRARGPLLGVTLALFATALVGAGRLGTQLVPDLAQGEFAFELRAPEGTPLLTTAALVERLEASLLSDPHVERVSSVVGSLPSSASGRQTLGENLARIDLALPAGASAADEARAVARVRQALAQLPNLEGELVRSQALSLQAPVEVQLFGDDLAAIDQAAARVAAALGELPTLRDVSTTSEPGAPEVRVALDRERIAAVGLRTDGVAEGLRRQLRGEVIGQLREGEDRRDIRVRAQPRFRDRARDVERLPVRLPSGQAVPVSALGQVTIERGPAAIHRAGGGRVGRVTAAARTSDLARTLVEVRAAVDGLDLPPGVIAELSGQDRELAVSLRSLRLALLLAVFGVFVVMAVQFESILHPLVILLAVPLGAVGVVAALLLTGTPISVLALIGGVVLAGIVVNNAIVLVDAVNRRRANGEDLDQALIGGGGERLRPILMTTTTTVLALLPMALGLGAGDELRRPLALAVIGGLSGATLLTLIVVPCLYRLLGALGAGAAATGSTPDGATEEPGAGAGAGLEP